MATRALLLIEDAARILRLEPAEVPPLIENGELRGIEISPGVLRIAEADLRIFLRARRVPCAPPPWAEGSA